MSVLDTATARCLVHRAIEPAQNVGAPHPSGRPTETGYYFIQSRRCAGMAVTEKYSNSSVFLYRVTEPHATPKADIGNATRAEPRCGLRSCRISMYRRSSRFALGVSLLEVRRLVSLYGRAAKRIGRRSPYLGAVSSASMIRYAAMPYMARTCSVVSGKNAPRFKSQTSLANPDLANATVVVSEGEAVVAENRPPRRMVSTFACLTGGPSRLLRVRHGATRCGGNPAACLGLGSHRVWRTSDVRA